MNIEYNFICIGAGKVGSILFKEAGRFFSCMKGLNAYLYLVDDADVTENDVLHQAYIKDDIGWNKAACLVQAVKDNLDMSHMDGMPVLDRMVKGYSIHASADTVDRLSAMAVDNGYTSDTRVFIVADCTNGNADALQAIEKFYESKENVVVLVPTDEHKVFSVIKLLGVGKKQEIPLYDHVAYNDGTALTMAHFLLAKIVDFISNKKLLENETVVDDIRQDNNNCISLEAQDKKKLIVCVGTGGTGGDFTKEIAKKLIARDDTALLLIDGDRVEEKNCERQPFSSEDIQQNKSEILKKGLINDYPELFSKIYTYPYYIDDVTDLEKAISETGISEKDTLVYLIGCVDNHRARQVMHMYYALHEDVLYIDSGNEFEYGEVVISVKKGGLQYSPSRAFYFRDVLTDNSPSASEMSCGVVNVSSPQHQITNLYAADIIYTAVEMALENDEVNGGIVYFDVFQYLRRFHAVGKEVLKQ